MDIAVASAAGCGLVSASLLYRAMRPKFPVTVNCHFCNIDTQVRYDERNSWTCDHCQQYNGFTTEGDYNRQVGVEEVRARFVKEQVRMEETDNGLCRGCNLNQQLKVSQLASYDGGDDWEVGVEEYKRHLDKVYRLCWKCEEVLSSRLGEQDASLAPSVLAHRLETSRLNRSDRLAGGGRAWIWRYLPATKVMMSLLMFIMLLDTSQLELPVTMPEFQTHHQLVTLNLLVLLSLASLTRASGSRWRHLLALTAVLAQLVAVVADLDHASMLGLAGLSVLCSLVVATSPGLSSSRAVNRTMTRTRDSFLARPAVADSREDEDETMTQNLLEDSDIPEVGEKSSSSHTKDKARLFGPSEYELRRPFSHEWSKPASVRSFLSEPKFSSHVRPASLFSQPLAPAVFTSSPATRSPQKDVDISSLSLGDSPCDRLSDSSPFAPRLYSPASSPSGIHFSPPPPARRNLLRPARLTRSWVAGGYWAGGPPPTPQETPGVSRSSSQSSGFVSHSGQPVPDLNQASLPNSPVMSACGDYERFSVLSEPIFRPRGDHALRQTSSVVGGAGGWGTARRRDRKYHKRQRSATPDSSDASVDRLTQEAFNNLATSTPHTSPKPEAATTWSLTITLTPYNITLAASVAVNMAVAFYWFKNNLSLVEL